MGGWTSVQVCEWRFCLRIRLIYDIYRIYALTRRQLTSSRPYHLRSIRRACPSPEGSFGESYRKGLVVPFLVTGYDRSWLLGVASYVTRKMLGRKDLRDEERTTTRSLTHPAPPRRYHISRHQQYK